MTTIIVISILLICILEGIPLMKKKMWKELLSVGSILLICLSLQIGKNLGIMTPINLIEKLFEPLGRTFFNKL